MIIEGILIIVSIVLGYTWAGYPLVLAIFARKKGEENEFSQKGTTFSSLPAADGNSLTQVSGFSPQPSDIFIFISAYNEEAVIKQRLQNLVEVLSQSTNQRINESTNIFLGVDGSTDRTAEIAREFADNLNLSPANRDTLQIQIHEFKERRGKIAVLKELVKECSHRWGRMKTDGRNLEQKVTKFSSSDRREGVNNQSSSVSIGGDSSSTQVSLADSERRLGQAGFIPQPSDVFIFTDANTVFRKDALEKLLRHFDDPDVGGVCGKLIFLKENKFSTSYKLQVTSGEGVYWRFETWLKTKESCVDSCLGANGAIYAIRSELFWKEIPDNTIVDDFVIGMKAREQGFRMVYEPDAVAEEVVPRPKEEWERRVRIGSGDYQALKLCRKCLSPKYGYFSWMFWSHKVLRWFTPHMILVVALFGWGLVIKEGLSYWYWGDFSNYSLLTGMIISGLTVIAVLSAFLGNLCEGSNSVLTKPFRMCGYFLTMQMALFSGWLKYLRGGLKGYWERTGR